MYFIFLVVFFFFFLCFFFFSSRRRHTRSLCDWSSDVCSSDLTQAGKSALPGSHPLNLGGIGVTGTAAANSLGADADVVLAVGTRLQDFTTGSATLFDTKGCRILALNVQPLDAGKHGAIPLIADAREGLRALSEALGDWRAPDAWTERARRERDEWLKTAQSFTGASGRPVPSDAEVIGAVQRAARASGMVGCSSGGPPRE